MFTVNPIRFMKWVVLSKYKSILPRKMNRFKVIRLKKNAGNSEKSGHFDQYDNVEIHRIKYCKIFF